MEERGEEGEGGEGAGETGEERVRHLELQRRFLGFLVLVEGNQC